jgi:hypothetical protein|eukprot:COSAG05_NODE_351_length_10910_cov_25.021645_5_plen_153_part_00
MYAKGGILPGYEKSVPTQGSSGGGGGGGGFAGGSNTGRGRFAIYDYTARFGDKFWEVSRDDLNGKIVASDNNSNAGAINEQLARDWIMDDWRRRQAEEQGSGSGSGDGDDGSSGGSSSDDDDDGSSFPGLTDNQRFLLIGLVVVGLFAKRVM